MPCPYTTQSATRSEIDAARASDAIFHNSTRSFQRRENGDRLQASAIPHASRDVDEPSAACPAAPHRRNSTQRCAIPFLTPCTSSHQEERAMFLPSPPSRHKSPLPALRTLRLRRKVRRLWRSARRKPAPQLS